MRRRSFAGIVAIAASALLGRSSPTYGQTTAAPAVTAQCDDGAPSAIGNACVTGDGGAGSCLAEMCNEADDAGAVNGTTIVTCALCYAPGDGPPTLPDGSTVVTITTTSTTTTSGGGC